MAYRLLQTVVGWTLALLFLGSIVHATESSLACPDWPTCYGTMMPEMTGGVFWEHLHRIWAGILVVLFAGTWFVLPKDTDTQKRIRTAGLVGIGLLLFQSVLGGLTVIYRLPDAISTSHLGLAFFFLSLATVMMVMTGPRWSDPIDNESREAGKRAGLILAPVIFVQSLIGAWVRHTDAGVACPDVPYCLGQVVPPLDHPLVQIHFAHRAVGVLAAIITTVVVLQVFRRAGDPRVRLMAWGLGSLVVFQVLLGYVSVALQLSPPAVSLHTLVAATLLTLAVALGTYGWKPVAGSQTQEGGADAVPTELAR